MPRGRTRRPHDGEMRIGRARSGSRLQDRGSAPTTDSGVLGAASSDAPRFRAGGLTSSRTMTTGVDVLLEVLRTEGVTHVFGNPGTTELPLIDALAGADDLDYVLALQEATAVGDGRRATPRRPAGPPSSTCTRRPGSATPSATSPTPRPTAPRWWSPPASRTAATSSTTRCSPATSSAWPGPCRSGPTRCARLGELGTDPAPGLPRRRRRPPTGPVFVSLPMDLLDEEGDGDVPAPAPIRSSAGASAGGLDELADLLAAADRRQAGHRRRRRGGGVGRRRRARRPWPRRSARPCTARRCTRHVVFPPTHPLWAGDAGPRGRGHRHGPRPATTGCCSSAAGPSWSTPTPPARPCRPSVELLHLSPDPRQLGRTCPTAPRPCSATRRPRSRRCSPLVAARADAAAARRAVDGARHARRRALDRGARPRARYDAVAHAPDGRRPRPAAGACPPDTAVVDEAITTGVYVRRLPPRRRRPAATSSAGAAGWAGACRPPSACRSASAASRCCASSATASAMYSPPGAVDGGPRAAAGRVRRRRTTASTSSSRTTCGAWTGALGHEGQLRGHGPRPPAGRLRRPGPLDGRRGHAGREGAPTSATPCGPPLAAGRPAPAATSPSPPRREPPPALRLRGVRLVRDGRAHPRRHRLDRPPRRAVGRARARTARARRRCCASPPC